MIGTIFFVIAAVLIFIVATIVLCVVIREDIKDGDYLTAIIRVLVSLGVVLSLAGIVLGILGI